MTRHANPPRPARLPLEGAPPIPEDLDELPRRLARALAAWKGVLAANLAAEGIGNIVPVGSGLVLFALYERDGWTVGELARRARVSHVAVLQTLHRLEKNGLTRRETCRDDRRVTRVWLTRRGRSLEPKMRALHARNLATLTHALGARDAVRLGSLLGRLIEVLAPHPEPPSPAPRAKRTVLGAGPARGQSKPAATRRRRQEPAE